MIQSGITARRAGDILEIPVSTLYYKSGKAEQDMALASMIQETAYKYTFYGYRRIHVAINKAGVLANHKKVYRIYRGLSLQRLKPRKNKKLSVTMQLPLTEPLFCNHVWAIDFLFDNLTDGRRIKFMTVEDLFSRFAVGIDSRFSIPAKVVVEVIEVCIQIYDTPRVIRKYCLAYGQQVC